MKSRTSKTCSGSNDLLVAIWFLLPVNATQIFPYRDIFNLVVMLYR